ncbi:MAG TPA: glycosyltransferase family 39 protein, partial [Roseiflexaceae bacterium]|nr:glycosyltransferase family 39 protein [Roseiflexaceae bacterium]
MSVIALPRGANRAARFMPLVAIMLAGAALRLYLIADKSLWLDEAFSVWMGWQPLGAMWRYLVQLDQHPPLYYTLLHFWMWLGDSETVVRSFSALWGILTLPVIYAIGVRVGGPALGRLASLILALAPMHVQYAQDARMYAMLTFTASMALLCMVQLLGSGDEGPTTKDEAGPTAVVQPAPLVDSHSKPHPTWFGSINRWWLGLVIFTTLTMLGHNTALTFPLAQGLFIAGGLGIPALLRRACGADASLQARRLREWSLALGASLLLWLPWLPGLLVQVRRVDQEFWIPAPTWRSVVATWRDFVSAFGPNGPSIALILLAAGALALLGIWRLRRRPALLALLLLLIVVPFAGELLASLRRPIYYTRTLIWASIPFYVLLAAGLLQLRFRPLIVIATLALLLLNGASLANYYRNFEPEGWREAAGWLAPQVRGGDIILFNAGWTQIPFDYYYRQVGPPVEQRGLPADLFDRGILEPKMTDADVERLSQLIAGREHVWLVYSHNWYTDPQSI